MQRNQKEVGTHRAKRRRGVFKKREVTKMKKLLSVIIAVVAAFSAFAFTGCTDADNELVVYTEAGFAPFEYVKNGQIVGADVDIMQKVANKLGKTLKFENVNFDVIVDTVAAGKLTKVGAAGLSITDERKAKVAISVPYYLSLIHISEPTRQLL